MRVSVAFYRGGDDRSSEPLLNTLARTFTGTYVHCELVFDDPSTGLHNLACSVWQRETVFLKAKTFGRTNWTHIHLNLPQSAVRTIKTFCREQIGKPFNKWGFFRCLTPFPRYTDESVWFCSELVVSAFQRAGYLQNAIPATCTPTYLFEMLRSFDNCVGGNPLSERRGGLSSRSALKANLSMIRQWSAHVHDEV